MRSLVGALAASVMFVGVALAMDDPMAGAYGNTVTVTNANGETTKLVIREDKSYEATLHDGAVHKGTWSLSADGTQVCFTQTEPAPAEGATPACGMVQPGKKAGDSWEEGEGDQKITVSIVAGT
jgi:hypothetical protein